MHCALIFYYQDDRFYFPDKHSQYFVTNGFLRSISSSESDYSDYTKQMCDEVFFEDMRTLHFTGRNKEVGADLVLPEPVAISFKGIYSSLFQKMCINYFF